MNVVKETLPQKIISKLATKSLQSIITFCLLKHKQQLMLSQWLRCPGHTVNSVIFLTLYHLHHNSNAVFAIPIFSTIFYAL